MSELLSDRKNTIVGLFYFVFAAATLWGRVGYEVPIMAISLLIIHLMVLSFGRTTTASAASESEAIARLREQYVYPVIREAEKIKDVA